MLFTVTGSLFIVSGGLSVVPRCLFTVPGSQSVDLQNEHHRGSHYFFFRCLDRDAHNIYLYNFFKEIRGWIMRFPKLPPLDF